MANNHMKKMLKIVCHWGAANKNNDSTLHISQNGSDPKLEPWCFQRWWGCGTATFLDGWCEHKMVQLFGKAVRQYLIKLLILLPYNAATMLLGIYPKEFKTDKHLHTNVYSSIFHNCQNFQATKISLNRWVDKQTVVHPDMGYYSKIKRNKLPSHKNAWRGTC